MAKTLSVRRGRKYESDATDEFTHGGYRMINADFLIARVDLESDGNRIIDVKLDEANHTGLIAEWTAGTATTILEAALDLEIQNIDEGTDIPSHPMSGTQQTNIINRATTWPSP